MVESLFQTQRVGSGWSGWGKVLIGFLKCIFILKKGNETPSPIFL